MWTDTWVSARIRMTLTPWGENLWVTLLTILAPTSSAALSRAVDALRRRKTATIYLAFADKPPLEMLEVHRTITGMGMFIRELIPRFNTYEGAEMFANTTFMARLATTEETKPTITGVFEGKMYTGEIRPTRRTYRCRCGEEIVVGVGGAYETVEELKSAGCPKCGGKEGFSLRRRERLGREPKEAG